VAWVRERTIPTERPQLAGEVSTKSADRGSHVVSVTDSYGSILGFLDRSHYLFLPSSSLVVLTRLSGPPSRPTTSQKMWLRREWNPDLWICGQEIRPLDHRGGHETAMETLNEASSFYCRCLQCWRLQLQLPPRWNATVKRNN
jgi:hypothetical protein